MDPGTGGVIQRRARPRPNDCTLPAAASAPSAIAAYTAGINPHQRQGSIAYRHRRSKTRSEFAQQQSPHHDPSVQAAPLRQPHPAKRPPSHSPPEPLCSHHTCTPHRQAKQTWQSIAAWDPRWMQQRTQDVHPCFPRKTFLGARGIRNVVRLRGIGHFPPARSRSITLSGTTRERPRFCERSWLSGTFFGHGWGEGFRRFGLRTARIFPVAPPPQ